MADQGYDFRSDWNKQQEMTLTNGKLCIVVAESTNFRNRTLQRGTDDISAHTGK